MALNQIAADQPVPSIKLADSVPWKSILNVFHVSGQISLRSIFITMISHHPVIKIHVENP
jgi:hypothetical protein